MSWPNRMGPLQFRLAVSIVLPQALQPYFCLCWLHFECISRYGRIASFVIEKQAEDQSRSKVSDPCSKLWIPRISLEKDFALWIFIYIKTYESSQDFFKQGNPPEHQIGCQETSRDGNDTDECELE